MAIVKTIQHRWGGVIRVADDCYRGVPESELARRREATQRAASRIIMAHARAEATRRAARAAEGTAR